LQVAFGSVSVAFFRNTINLPPNSELPKLSEATAGGGADGGTEGDRDDDEERVRILPAELSHLRKMNVAIGKFG
jgi:hypothetical protein